MLEIDNIHKDFDGVPVLRGINLTVHKQEALVILGPSGCGKSTLLRCVNGLERIQSGEIRLDGIPISGEKTDFRAVRQKVGMVFQSYELFPHLTALENITLGPRRVQKRGKKEAEDEASALLDRVGLLEKKDYYPRQLSGGQKQRVAIVRALAMQPEIMLFDEVTAALDPEMVREVLDVMFTLAKTGMTMLIVTHEMSFARAVADKIIFIDKGEIVEENTPAAFFTQPATERARKFLNIFEFKE
ncbi:MAG: amino acid ABC transporter ATP-binding protein [Spirochaetaceae bacterium]|nr:amino acid ABC transporter ATP-binding protein [Spirochaetaceae bacterium]